MENEYKKNICEWCGREEIVKYHNKFYNFSGWYCDDCLESVKDTDLAIENDNS